MSGDIDANHVTTDRTIRRATETGFAYLESAPGEAHASDVPSGEPIAALWHLSDLHLCDAESPARLEYLDRHGDSDSPHREELGDVGTYRPQEILTVQVAVAMVETVNAVRTGPTTGMAIDGVVLTGDIVDNAQENELGWYQQIVEGGVLHPWSGDAQLSSWVGVSNADKWDERYWHPDGPPPECLPDRPTTLFGFPRVSGLIEAARRDVVSPGLALDWVTVHGNHDLLLQGTVAVTEDLQTLATGDARILDLPSGVSPRVTLEATAPVGPARYPHDSSSPRTSIVSDPTRRMLETGDFPRATGLPTTPPILVRCDSSVSTRSIRTVDGRDPLTKSSSPGSHRNSRLRPIATPWCSRIIRASRSSTTTDPRAHPIEFSGIASLPRSPSTAM